MKICQIRSTEAYVFYVRLVFVALYFNKSYGLDIYYNGVIRHIITNLHCATTIRESRCDNHEGRLN